MTAIARACSRRRTLWSRPTRLPPGTKGLYAFDADTGEQAWHYRATGGSGSWSAQTLGDDLYAAWSGKLFRFSGPGA
ncbi:hypothetical protein [Streptomyces sp. NPDC087300]|uniref:hypothetical protein n=1 Tax=Streptomyces sp. NPDC087300 TaxID=3365780 RepID=UPI00381E23F4